MKKNPVIYFAFLVLFSIQIYAQIPTTVLVSIIKAEDERRFDRTLEDLLKSPNEKIRVRAALAAGRIGDENSIPALVNLHADSSNEVRAMSAFALGEIESTKGADAIIKILSDTKTNPEIRVRAVEAAGKIAAANAKDEKSKQLGAAILETLRFEDEKRSGPFENIIELGLTAVLRARPENSEPTLIKFINAYTPKIRANALNALARLRAKNANEKARELLQKDADPIVRANAARVLGAAEDKNSFDLLVKTVASDRDSRVRVSAIRSLGSLKDARAANALLERGEIVFNTYKSSKYANPSEKNELLEIAAVLGNLLSKTKDEKALNFLDKLIVVDKLRSAEIPVARIRISQVKFNPADYGDLRIDPAGDLNVGKNLFQLFGEVSSFGDEETSKQFKEETKEFLSGALKNIAQQKTPENNIIDALPDLLNSYARFKTDDLGSVLLNYITHKDLFIRATVAGLLSEQPATKESIEALKTAFAESLKTDKYYNDAQLATLSALVKLDKSQSLESLKLALTAPDYLVRKHAAGLIKQNDLVKEFPNADQLVGTIKPYNPKTGTKLGQLLNAQTDYWRAVSRKSAKAILTTEKGSFTIEFTPEAAPLTVDNFIKLAKAKYFDGLAIHRVVPNFVMQDGDPRGDGNGGPGYSIRCELNMLEYERGAVGMALSGKDTGGSQWFVTHSPQPHLDGGYTVFGRVNETDMKIVDNLVRGDKILSVKIIEGTAPLKKGK